MKKMLLAILIGFSCIFAVNPICTNYDEQMTPFYGCYVFSDNQFVKVFKRWPTFSNGEPFPEEGEGVYWNDKAIWIPEYTGKQFTKNDIVFVTYNRHKMVYQCDYEVFNVNEVNIGEISFAGFDIEYGVNYFNCGLHNIETDSSLVTFAQNDYQRHVLSELEALASVQSGENDLMEYGHWEIYRKDGTLRFVGDNHEGYCMSKNGMKKVKKVNSPIYCK